MKKKFMGIALVLASALFVGHVSASEMKLQELKIQDNSDSYKGAKTNIVGNGTSNVTITYDAAKFVLVEPNPEVGRNDKAAWFGLQIMAPSGLSKEEIEKATYDHGNGTDKNNFWKSKDSKETEATPTEKHFIYVYGAITQEHLTNATEKGIPVTYTWRFDWDGNSTIDQVVTVYVKTEKAELKDENNETLWDDKTHDAVVAETELKAEQAKVASVVTVEENGVNVTGTLLKEDDAAYKTMLEKVTGKGFKTVFGAYELETTDTIGKEGITLTFKVGTEHNGKAAYILHQKQDKSIEEFNAVVTDGVVKITVSELSPFMVALGDVVKVKDAAAETGDVFPIAIVGIITLGLAGTYTFRKLHD